MRKSLGLGIGLSAAVIVTALTPAAGWAAVNATGPSVPTTVTFTVTSGALAITAPDAANLGSGAPGTTITSALGGVTVTDSRALLSAAWTVTASATDFITGAHSVAETIPVGDAKYNPGPITTTGVITVAGSNITLSGSPQTVVTGTAGVGDNSATWTPTIAVAVPANAVGGLYTGTITQSVA